MTDNEREKGPKPRLTWVITPLICLIWDKCFSERIAELCLNNIQMRSHFKIFISRLFHCLWIAAESESTRSRPHVCYTEFNGLKLWLLVSFFISAVIYSDAISKRISHDRILWSVLYLFMMQRVHLWLPFFFCFYRGPLLLSYTQPIVCYSCFRFTLVFLSFIVYFGYGVFF